MNIPASDFRGIIADLCERPPTITNGPTYAVNYVHSSSTTIAQKLLHAATAPSRSGPQYRGLTIIFN
jgi:hypothetical protein